MRTSERYFLGIDVSKGYADFHLMNEQKRMAVKGFQLDDSQQGHQVLQELINSITSNGKTVICGIESTGGYEQNWVVLLKRMQKTESVEVYKLNPKAVKHQIASHLKRTINDAVSAEGIAEYVANNYRQCKEKWTHSTQQDPADVSMQQFFRFINAVIKQQTARYNQLEKLLYQNFPELLSYCKQGVPNWMIRMLIKFPTASVVRKISLKRMDAIKGITEDKAKALKELAVISVAKESSHIDQIMISELASDIQHQQQRINTYRQILIENYQSNSVQFLKSIRGIGDWSAAGISVMLGDVTRFKDANQLVAFFGVHPRFKQSGDGKWGSRMSKQGDRHMRALLFVAANNVILHNDYFRSLYQKHLDSGKKPKVVKGIIMHKLLRVIYGILKSQLAFDHQIDMANHEKHTASEIKLIPISMTSRRLQPITLNAPISRSNHKKRRAVLEHLLSSCDNHTASSQTAIDQS